MSIRSIYEQYGVDEYYLSHARNYINPHMKQVSALVTKAKGMNVLGNKVLDLCCGTGEVTQCIQYLDVVGCDPYTYDIYVSNTGNKAYNMSFLDIVNKGIDNTFDSIVCSFALHLCPESMLPLLLWRLNEVSSTLVVISPHKRPNCDGVSGWVLVYETMVDRVRLKIYFNDRNKFN